MLNDIGSRIPVEVGASRIPALMVGDNSELPLIVYLGAGVAVRADDEVMTSGASGEFPRGIRVGRIALADGQVRVRTDARLVPGSYLTVLLYYLPSVGTRAEGLAAARPNRSLDGPLVHVQKNYAAVQKEA